MPLWACALAPRLFKFCFDIAQLCNADVKEGDSTKVCVENPDKAAPVMQKAHGSLESLQQWLATSRDKGRFPPPQDHPLVTAITNGSAPLRD